MIIVFGGAFNPPTKAHQEIIKHLLTLPRVKRVIVVPVGDHYEKSELESAEHRIEMLKLMLEDLPKVSISTLEVDGKKALKTIETMTLIQKYYPHQKSAFVMGTDNLTQLKTWHKYEQLIKEFNIIVYNRTELDVQGYIEEEFGPLASQFTLLEGVPVMPVSSTAFRENPANIELLPENVVTYIKENRLYDKSSH